MSLMSGKNLKEKEVKMDTELTGVVPMVDGFNENQHAEQKKRVQVVRTKKTEEKTQQKSLENFFSRK